MDKKYWFERNKDGEAISYNVCVYGNNITCTKRIEMALIEQAVVPLMDMADNEVENEYFKALVK